MDAEGERKIRKPAGARHAPAGWIMRAQMILFSREGLRTSAIAAEPGCHMQTVRERIERFNAEGLPRTGRLNTRAHPWVRGRPPPQPRTPRREFVYLP
ncbi:helix-turn-helix domain-containing protein [Streptosporangium minutum]|uniref:helix-turn-helix domain-containing protein n=1 Tax=Streptosporangium minutum TaxID=569862 RepID=UPI001F605AAE|nr:helix-turn-helix domain-containing protein [Streptosporangium minutum]